MTLSVGNRLVKLDHSGNPIMGDNAFEVHVEFEVLAVSGYHQERGENGEFAHEDQVVLLRKVR